jgi:hypothetical protein
MAFMKRINETYFDGMLSTAVMEHLESINDERPEVQSFVERMARQMKDQRFHARDFNEVKAWVLGSFLAKILPGAWGGMVPPITLEGRHADVDEYMARNRWRKLGKGDAFLDLGCGFPPRTTIDSAKRFPDVQLVGADPSFGRYLVQDPNGDYACFDDERDLLYFQTPSNEADRWEALFEHPVATKDRFFSYLQDALDDLPDEPGVFARTEVRGFEVSKNPVLQYERDNLRFERGGVGATDLGEYAMVRLFNVLCYFDHDFRRTTLEWLGGVVEDGGLFLTGMDWSRSRNARYAVYQAEGGCLVPREFAFSVEGIRPIEIISWFALHDDDFEMQALAELIGTIRTDEHFRTEYDRAYDALLAETGYTSRKADGFLGTAAEDVDPAVFDSVAETVGKGLETKGFPQRAAETLNAAGYDAWVNCVGHIAVDPAGFRTVEA